MTGGGWVGGCGCSAEAVSVGIFFLGISPYRWDRNKSAPDVGGVWCSAKSFSRE